MTKIKNSLFDIDIFKENEADIIVFGLKYTKDSEKVLNEVRKWSYFIEPYDVIEKKNLLENLRVFDYGNLSIKSIERIFQKTINKNKVPLILSRGHFSSYFILSSYPHSNIKVLIFDAHADCKDKYIDELISFDTLPFFEKEKFNGATWLRRLLEKKRIKTCLIGVRAFEEEEVEFLKKNNVKYFSPEDLKKRETFKFLEKFTDKSMIYISLDMDVFDPIFFDCTDYPEPEGINLYQFRKVLKSIKGKITAIDLCCFNLEGTVKPSYFFLSKCICLLLQKIKK